MRKLMLIFVLVTAVACKAQVVKQDLYIFTDRNPVREVSDGTSAYQKFDIDFDATCSSKVVNIAVNDSGSLEKNIKVKATANKIVSLVYKNQSGDNNPRQINRGNIVNFLTYDEILCNLDIEKFMQITSRFNIYLVQGERNSDTVFLAKKVTLERYRGM